MLEAVEGLDLVVRATRIQVRWRTIGCLKTQSDLTWERLVIRIWSSERRLGKCIKGDCGQRNDIKRWMEEEKETWANWTE